MVVLREGSRRREQAREPAGGVIPGGGAARRGGGGGGARTPRPSPTEPIFPRPIACIRMLPAAVASIGPAWTGRLQASAVNWQSSAFRDPPPTTRIVRLVVPRVS